MALQLVRAKRSEAYLKLGISAPSGGGKTASALLIGYGLLKGKYPDKSEDELWSKIAIVDTENGSGQLYVGSTIGRTRVGQYNAITLNEPYTVEKYIEAIDLCENNDIEVCIVDSTTHAWSGEGGLLEQQGNVAKRIGNSYAAWREITPLHNDFVNKMLHSKMHVIATMRSKQEYVQEKDERTGKTTVRKMGLEPEQRKGMEFEFTVFFEINAEHEAFGSKDRTGLFDQQTFVPTPDTGRKIMDWLESREEGDSEVVATAPQRVDPQEAMDNSKSEIIQMCKDLGGSADEELMGIVKAHAPSGNPNSIKDNVVLAQLRSELIELKEKREQLDEEES